MIEQCNEYWQTGELEYPYGRGINFQIEIDNIEVLLQKLKEHNIPLFRDLMIHSYSEFTQKEFIVQDPDGYLLRFCQSY